MSQIIKDENWYRNLPKHVMVTRHFCLTSPVSNYVPSLPKDDFQLEANDLSIHDMPFLRFDFNSCPQLAFVPKEMRYVGPMLSRLAHYKVVRTPEGRWALDPCVMESWRWLEMTLTHAISALSADCLLPMTVGFFDYPESLGYQRSHKKVGQATMCIKSSRTAFAALLGLFSMFYSFRAELFHRHQLSPLAGLGSKEKPRDIVKARTSLNDRTIQDLEDMHALLGPRIGVVINPTRNAWADQFYLALAWANIDHWFYWSYPFPPQPALRSLRYMRFRPDPQFVRTLYDKLLLSPKQSIISSPPHSITDSPDGPCNPPPNEAVSLRSSSSPPKDKPFVAFFAAREAKFKDKAKNATPGDLQRWNSRRASAKHILEKNWEPNKKSKLFHWSETNGSRVRTNITPGEWDLVWLQDQHDRPRSHGQRRYCEYTDEWDVCTEFDEACEIGPVSKEVLDKMNEFDEDDAGNDPWDFGPVIPYPPLRSSSPQAPLAPPSAKPVSSLPLPIEDAPDSSNPRIQLINGNPTQPPPLPPNFEEMGAELISRHTVPEIERIEPPLDEILFARFGLDVSLVASDLRSGIIRLEGQVLTLEEVAAVLMEKYGSANTLMRNAVSFIVTKMQREKTVSPKYWDLHPDSPESVRLQGTPYFTFVSIQTHLQHDHNRRLEGYEVLPVNPRDCRPWTVVFDSAIAATQCIRERWGPSLEDVVEKAVKGGHCIRVLRKYAMDKLPPRREPPVLFGRRERGSEFRVTDKDYTAFLSVVEVLMQQPRLTSVIFRGGILARICMKFVYIQDLLEGPSLDAETYGLRWVGMGNDCWVEDYISELETELLTGTFYIATGRGAQFAKKSFFPSPSIWESSGLNTKIWSNSAEEKYQSILESITRPDSEREPSARPRVRTAAEWRHNMRHFKNKTRNFLGLVESQAHTFIRGMEVH